MLYEGPRGRYVEALQLAQSATPFPTKEHRLLTLGLPACEEEPWKADREITCFLDVANRTELGKDPEGRFT